jgi:uroporphyrinogen III methyltransferase/synthase
MPYSPPLVYLVGAGPGHPGLVTVRAVECLARADVVIYDRLVPSHLLDHVPTKAERVCLTELADRHVDRAPKVLAQMIAAARLGKCVVRLKGGDPLVFGRGGEEAQALHEAGIPFEIVPGLTSGLAAAACAGIPVTDRQLSSAVALVTGHEDPSKPGRAIDWAALARFPGTLVIYMGLSRLPQIVASLLVHGMDGDTPAVIIQQGATGEQRTLESTLAGLPEAVAAARFQSPSIIIIGRVVSLRRKLQWFERRPLFGKHVLVTRPRSQAEELTRRLEELGAVCHLLPTVVIREPSDWSEVDRALRGLSQFQWLVFTSSNGVRTLLRRLAELELDLRALGHLKIAAIGPGTAEALRTFHLNADLVPSEFHSESLAAALKGLVAGQRVLLARADRGRELLRQELEAVANVEQVAVYLQVDAVLEGESAFQDLLRGQIEYVTLTSSNIARSLLRALDEPTLTRIRAGAVRLVSISPVTSAAIRGFGVPVAAEAAEYTTEGVVQALLRLVDGERKAG